ncbi:MAG: hypothetical protein KDI06_04315, partial [Calditrichaeota bacterium]|nr:hypothetical protein [Calditrichota bacterium]
FGACNTLITDSTQQNPFLLLNREITKARKIYMFSHCQAQYSRVPGDNLPFAAVVRERFVSGRAQTEKTFVISRFRGL